MQTDITTAELKAAWHRAGLWRLGISFQRAIDSPLILSGLRLSARAYQRKHQPKPQLRLI